MAKGNGGQINFGVGFNVDKSELNDLKKAIDQIYATKPSSIIDAKSITDARARLTEIQNTAGKVEEALTKAFNPKLNTVNITKFNTELANSGLTLEQIYKDFSQVGDVGQRAFTKLSAEILTTNTTLKNTQTILDKMGETLINSVKWNISSSVINGFTSAIQSAYNYVKVLDASLTDIRVVTGDSREQMDKFAESANSAAAALGRQTKEYTNAYLTFAQQGLGASDREARTEATLKAANITGADVADMADDLTAVWNGFKIQAQDTEQAVSKLAAVADTSASDMSELATAMSKSASVANNMGVTIDQLAAQIATITQVTRQAPETTGNALKTIYARINDIKAGTDDAEVSLGNYTGKMAELGINVLDANGELRDTGDVMTEIGEKWGSMTREQQIYLAQTMAGQRQMNNLIALFDNWDTYTKELNTSLAASNELNEKNDIYMDSLKAHLNELTAAQEGLIQAFSDTDSFKGLVDIGTNFLNIFTQLVDAIGGGGNALLSFGAILTRVFSKNIATQISNIATNIQNTFSDKNIIAQAQATAKALAGTAGIQNNEAVKAMVDQQQQTLPVYRLMTQEQQNYHNELLKQLGTEAQKAQELRAQLNTIDNCVKALSGINEGELKSEAATQKWQADVERVQKSFDLIRTTLDQISNTGDNNQRFAVLDNFANDLAKNFANPAEFAPLQTLLNDIQKIKVEVSATGQISDAQIATVQGDLFNLIGVINDASTASENYGNTAQEWQKYENAVKAVIEAIKENRAQAERTAQIQKVTNTISSLGTVTMGVSNLTNMIANLGDESLTAGERITQFLSSAAMSLPMVISGFASLYAALGPIGVLVGAISAAIPVVTKVVDQMHVSAQEAKEALEDSIKEYSQGQDDLESLNNQLADIQDKIKQIQDQGTITLTDAQELANLKAQNEELKAEIDNQKRLNELKAEQTNEDTRTAFKSGSFDMADRNANYHDQDVDAAKAVGAANGETESLLFIDQFDKKSEEAYKRAIQAANDGQIPKDIQAEIDEWEDNYRQILEDEAAKMSQAQDALPAALATQDNELISKLEGVIEQYYKDSGQLEDRVSSAWQSVGLNKDQIDSVKDSIADLVKQGQGLDTSKLQNLIGSDKFETLKAISDSLGISLETLVTDLDKIPTELMKVEDAADEAQEKLDSAELIEQIDIGAKAAEDAINKLTKGTKLTDDNTEALSSELALLGEQYPDLARSIDIVSEKMSGGAVSASAYADAVKEIEDAISEAQFENTLQAAQDAADKFIEDMTGMESLSDGGNATIKVDISDEAVERFEQNFDDYLDAEHEIDVNIQTNMDEAIGDVQSKFDTIAGAASKIGDNFVVAAKDLSTLSDAFPGILQGMQELSDGSYQLNQDIVNNAIGAATAETSANAQSVAARIEQNIALMEDKEEQYRAIAAAAQTMASSQVNTEGQAGKAKEAISNAVKQVRIDDSQMASNMQMTDHQDVASDADQKFSAIASNAASSASSASASVAAWANSAIDSANKAGQAMAAAHQAMETGEYSEHGQDAKGVTISSNYQGSKTTAGQTSSSSADLSNLDSGSAIDDYVNQFENVQEGYQAIADAATKAANEIDKSIAKERDNLQILGATANGVAEGITNVANGKSYTPSKTKKSKKGSGSKGRSKKPKTETEVLKNLIKDSDIDKYHEIDRSLEDINDQIDRLDKLTDKSIRKGREQSIDNQVEALEKEKALYENKIDLMQKDLAQQQTNLKSMLAGYEVQFDAQGNIINYTNLAIQFQNEYNNLLREAAGMTDAEAQDVILKQAKAAKQRYENLKAAMDSYEKLQDTLQDTYDKVQDIVDKEQELKIEKFKIQIDTDLDIADAKRDWNKFKKQVIDKIKDNDYLGQAKARMQDFFSYYDENGNGIIQQLTDHVNKTKAELESIENTGWSDVYGNNEEQALEDLKKYTDDLMQNLEDSQQILKDIHDLVLDTIDKLKDAYDDQADAYDQMSDILEHDINLVQLLKPVNNEDQLDKYYNLREKYNNQELEFYRKQTDMWKQQMDAAEVGTEEWKKFRDNWMDSLSNLNSAVEDAVQNLIDKYNNTITKIVRTTKDQLMGGDWQKAMDEWDKAKWNDDRYLDIATRATKVLDFVDDVNKAMEGKPIEQQQELLKLMNSEVDSLNNMTRVRQIDLDLANKKLEVLQKQQALEDAQKNKSDLRLRRDSQGNYSYQYVANENDITAKQQELRDALEELRQLAKTDISDTMDEVEDKLNDFFERATELSQQYYDDQDTLKQKLLELEDEYFGEEGYITLLGVDYNTMQGQLLEATGAQFTNLYDEQREKLMAFLGLDEENAEDNSVFQSIKQLIGADGGKVPELLDIFTTSIIPDNFAKISQANQDLLFGSDTGMDPAWNTALGHMAQNYTAMTTNVILPMMDAMIQADGIYIGSLNGVAQAAGIDFGLVNQGIDSTIGETVQLIATNGGLITTYQQELSAIQNVYNAMQSLVSEYQAAEQAAINAANAALKYWAAVQGNANAPSIRQDQSSGSGGTNISAKPVANNASSPRSSNGGAKSGGSSSKKGTPLQKEAKQTRYKIVQQTNKSGHWENTRDADLMNSERTGTTSKQYAESRLDRYFNGGKAKTEFQGYQTRYQVVPMDSYDTGGYTGEWPNGSEKHNGKLAWLHQKELILNKDDTKNMLNAVQVARDIVSKVTGLGSSSLENAMSTASGLLKKVTGNGGESEQNFYINAEFPNATDGLSIQQAIKNLPNIAIQRAHSNRK